MKSESGPFNPVYTLAALKNFDGVAVPGSLNGGNTVTLGAADVVTTQPITYVNAPAGYSKPVTFAYFDWKSGGQVLLSGGADAQYPVVPAAAAESGDLYDFTAFAISGGQSVFVLNTSSTAGPQTFTFPASWGYAGPTPAALPSFDMTYPGFAGKTGVINIVGISWTTGIAPPPSTETTYSFRVLASGNYLNGTTTLPIPDLSGVTGFTTPPVSGTNMAWQAEVIQSGNGFLSGSAAGLSNTGVQSTGQFIVP